MTKRDEGGASRPAPQAGEKPRQPRASAGSTAGIKAADKSRVDKLVALIDHCAVAKEGADGLGEKFLSYLLAMAIQESRAAIRRTGPLGRLTN